MGSLDLLVGEIVAVELGEISSMYVVNKGRIDELGMDDH